MEVAIKQFRMSLETIGPVNLRTIYRELIILSSLRHGRTLTLLHKFRDSDNIYLVTQYYQRKSLHHLMYQENMNISKHHWCILALDICTGLAYLHNPTNPIIHLDLKPKNILIDGFNEPRAILADFGLSMVKSSSTATTHSTPKGTYQYMAPEMGQGKPTEKADIYSFAIILWEMLHRKQPFFDMEVQAFQILESVRQGVRPSWNESIHLSLKELIIKSWATHPEERYSARQLEERINKIQHSVDIKF